MIKQLLLYTRSTEVQEGVTAELELQGKLSSKKREQNVALKVKTCRPG